MVDYEGSTPAGVGGEANLLQLGVPLVDDHSTRSQSSVQPQPECPHGDLPPRNSLSRLFQNLRAEISRDPATQRDTLHRLVEPMDP